MTTHEYFHIMSDYVMNNRCKYLHMLLGLCGYSNNTIDSLTDYFNGGCLTATREEFNTIEGVMQAFVNVVTARVECYNPCQHMIDEINRVLYNDNEFDCQTQFVDGNGTDRTRLAEDNAFQIMTHPTSLQNLAEAMAVMLSNKIYTKFHIPTVILYAEAVLLSTFESIWDITTVDVPTMKSMIAEARSGNTELLINNFMNNVISLNDVQDKDECHREIIAEHLADVV